MKSIPRVVLELKHDIEINCPADKLLFYSLDRAHGFLTVICKKADNQIWETVYSLDYDEVADKIVRRKSLEHMFNSVEE